MTPVVAAAIGIVWGVLLTLGISLAWAAGRPTPPVNEAAQERKAAQDFRPRLHGVGEVGPEWSHPWSPAEVADAAYREGWDGGRSFRARRPS